MTTKDESVSSDDDYKETMDEMEEQDESEKESVNELEQPRVPLTIDPEFLDPDQGKYKYGVIYLSYIPEGLHVRDLREIMEKFGKVGRIYLVPSETDEEDEMRGRKKKKSRSYEEGWVEFKKKRVAKEVAKELNNTPLQHGRKRNKINGQIWSLKYLHRFKWAHLTQQLAHDRATKEQQRRFEMSQAKKQVDFYQKMTERSKREKKLKKDTFKDVDEDKKKALSSQQNKPKSKGEELTVSVDEDLLLNIFKKVA